MTPTTPTREAAERVPLSEVEHALNGKLFDLQQGLEVVQRVRMSNLMIYCDTHARADEVLKKIPAVVDIHPARVLLLIGEGGAHITASVAVEAHSLGHNQQACSEVVILEAGGAAVRRLHFAVRSLLIGDLPTNLWWAAKIPPPLGGELMHQLAEQAQQILYDSIGWPQPAMGVLGTATWLQKLEETRSGSWRRAVASDLNWRRLKYWRRSFGQALDPINAPGAAESITELHVEHGPHAVVQGWLLISWLAHRLGWTVEAGEVDPNVEIELDFRAPHGKVHVTIARLAEGPPRITEVRLNCKRCDAPVWMNMTQHDSRLVLTLDDEHGEPRTMSVPQHTSGELVAKQLSDREHDPVFYESMRVARILAQSVTE